MRQSFPHYQRKQKNQLRQMKKEKSEKKRQEDRRLNQLKDLTIQTEKYTSQIGSSLTKFISPSYVTTDPATKNLWRTADYQKIISCMAHSSFTPSYRLQEHTESQLTSHYIVAATSSRTETGGQ